MTIKELLIQEIDSTPDELLADLLSLVRSLKSPPHRQLNSYEQLLNRIDYLEAYHRYPQRTRNLRSR